MQFQSWPEVLVDIVAGGNFDWKKQRSTLTFADDLSVIYRLETFEASSPFGLSADVVFTGTITASDGDGRIRFKVAPPAKSDRFLRFDALLLDSELLCYCYSELSGARFSKLFRSSETPKPFPRIRSDSTHQRKLVVVREEAKAAFQRRTICPSLVAPLKGEEFKRELRRLNYQLRKHGGKTAIIKLRSLQEHQRDFLAHILAGPLDFMKTTPLV